MDDVIFENPTFDLDRQGEDDDFDTYVLPEVPAEEPDIKLPIGTRKELNRYGRLIPTLWGQLRESSLEAQKKRLVKAFYKEAYNAYNGLLPEGGIDFDQFRIDPDDARTLYWTPKDKNV